MAEIEYQQDVLGHADGIKVRSDIYINVEVYGGSDIASVCRDMVRLASHLGITVWATLNGVRTLARPMDDPSALFHEWDKASRSGSPYKYAST